MPEIKISLPHMMKLQEMVSEQAALLRQSEIDKVVEDCYQEERAFHTFMIWGFFGLVKPPSKDSIYSMLDRGNGSVKWMIRFSQAQSAFTEIEKLTDDIVDRNDVFPIETGKYYISIEEQTRIARFLKS